jgi:type II secretory pathway pseudopilin PulG
MRSRQRFYQRERSEEGFTLIELVVVTLILPVIVGALAIALISVFSLQAGVSNRVSDSADAQTISNSFVNDVQSAQLLTTESAPTGLAPCGSSSQILGLQWGVEQTGVTQTEVSYVEVNNTLVRNVCQDGNSTTPVQTSVVSYDLPSTASCPPTSAGGQCTTVTPSPRATAAAAGWVPTPGIAGVALAILEPKSGYTFTLDGVPRDWTPASGSQPGGGQPLFPLELLGGTGTCANTAVLSLSGGSTINVGSGSGPLGVISPCPNSIQVSGGSNLNASSVVTANRALNSVNVSSGSTGPSLTAAETYQSTVSNPLASLVAPTNPTTALSGSCSVLIAYQSYTCSPGNYSSLSVSGGFTGGASIAFGSGTYVFTSAVSIANNNSVTFGSGTYWFEGGLSIGGGITASFGTGTYIFGTPSTGTGIALSVAGGTTVDGSAGVLFYIEGGSVDMTGGAGILLTGLSQYDYVAIWDLGASGSTNPLQLSGGSSSTVISGGSGIYVPNGGITISGSKPTKMRFVVTSAVSQSGGTTLDVG